jgi:archaellum component FlaC
MMSCAWILHLAGTSEADKDKRIKRLTDEVGTLSKKIRTLEGDTNDRILTVLRALGIKVRQSYMHTGLPPPKSGTQAPCDEPSSPPQATLNPDGSIELADGRRLGPGGILAGGEGGLGHSASLTGGLDGADPSKLAAAAQAMISKLNRTVDSLSLEIRDLKKKFTAKKKQVESLEQDMKTLGDQKDDMERKMRAAYKELQGKYEKVRNDPSTD